MTYRMVTLVVAIGVVSLLGTTNCPSSEATYAQSAGGSTGVEREERNATIEGKGVRVATYNVNRGLAGDPEGIRAIRSTDADVVFLQETNGAWERVLRRAFGSTYAHREFRYCCLSGGVAVLSRYPIVDSAYIEPPDGGWFPGHRVELQLPEGRVQVLNVHLRPPRAKKGGVVVGMWTTPSIRREQMRKYLQVLKPDLPTIVVGDFNEQGRNNVLRLLRDEGMRCTLCREKPGATTWKWEAAVVGEVERRFDHVVYEKSAFGFRSVEVVEEGRSDHFPVVAELVPRFGP